MRKALRGFSIFLVMTGMVASISALPSIILAERATAAEPVAATTQQESEEPRPVDKYIQQLQDPEQDAKGLAEAVYGLSTSIETLGQTETDVLKQMVLSLQMAGALARIAAEYPIMNLLRNGDFEVGLEEPVFWKREDNGKAGLVWDMAEPYWGRGSVCVDASEEGSGRWVQEMGLPRDCESILISVVIKAEQAGAVRVTPEFLKEEPEGLRQVVEPKPAIQFFGEPEDWFDCGWQLCQREVSVPRESSRMRIALECAAHGKAWFDNVSIYPWPPKTAEDHTEDDRADSRVYPEGYVRNADTGEPVEGARVMIDPIAATHDVRKYPAFTLTDDRGWFEFSHESDGIPSKTSFLVVYHPAYRQRYFPLDIANARSLDLLLEPVGSSTLSGTVYVNGIPYGLRVNLELRGETGSRGQVLDGGTYRFSGLKGGMMMVCIQGEGLPRTYWSTVNVREGGESVQDVHIYLSEDYKSEVYLSGTVLDAESGEPVAGAEVAADKGFSQGTCVTNAKGRFRTSEPIMREDAEMGLFLRSEGYQEAAVTFDVSIDLHGDIEDITLWLVAE